MWRVLLLALLFPFPLHAEGEKAGDFDFYVLALSWSPSWCELEGDARRSPQCNPSHDYGFVLHGLWPQYESGWPSDCRSSFRDPSRGETGDMADIMGSSGSAWHQWKKHGRCSGLSAEDYFAKARQAYAMIRRPDIFRRLPKTYELPPKVIEEAFIDANENLLPDGVTVTCKAGMVQEVRICLTRDLEPRICSNETVRDCGARKILMSPIR